MRDLRDFEEPTARLWAAGYRIEIPAVAVHESESRLGALDRYLQQIEAFGRGRKIDLAINDACYDGVVRATGNLDTGPLSHAVFVVRRDASVDYSNLLDSSDRWLREADTPGAVERERNAPWSEQKSRMFAGVTGRTLQRIEALPPEMRDPARQELAAVVELARPLVHPAVYAAMQGALGPV